MGVENGAVSDIFHYTWCIKILIMASQDDATTGWCPNMVTPWQSDLLIGDALKGQYPHRPMPSQADTLTGRYPHRPISSQTNALSGRCPHWPIMSQADALTGLTWPKCPCLHMSILSQTGVLTLTGLCPHRPLPSQANAQTSWMPSENDTQQESVNSYLGRPVHRKA